MRNQTDSQCTARDEPDDECVESVQDENDDAQLDTEIVMKMKTSTGMEKVKRKRVWKKLKSGLYGWKSSVEKSSKTSNILPRTPSTPHKLQNTQTISKWLLTAREGGLGGGVIVRYFYRKLPKLCQSYQLYSNNRKDPKIYLEKNSGL